MKVNDMKKLTKKKIAEFAKRLRTMTRQIRQEALAVFGDSVEAAWWTAHLIEDETAVACAIAEDEAAENSLTFLIEEGRDAKKRLRPLM